VHTPCERRAGDLKVKAQVRSAHMRPPCLFAACLTLERRAGGHAPAKPTLEEGREPLAGRGRDTSGVLDEVQICAS
jgi:hypothetical protein